MSLYINQSESLMDETLTIRASGLKANEKYQLHMYFKHKNGSHFSWANFVAADDGTIDVARDSPYHGCYVERNPDGLFQAMEAGPDVKPGAYVPVTPPDPLTYVLHLKRLDGQVLDTLKHIKHWKHPLIRRTEIENETVTGTLFLPPGEGPFPTIIDIIGGNGGMRENRGAMLSNSGFAVLSLAYLSFKSMPKTIIEVDIEYFLRAAAWLQKQPFVGRIGIQGNSFGGSIVHAVTIRCPIIKACCSINGSHALDTFTAMRENGKPMATGTIHTEEHTYYLDNYLVMERVSRLMDVSEEAEFKYDKVPKDTAFRIVTGIDDKTYNGVHSAPILEKEIRKEGLYCDMDFVIGGHLLEPPHMPNCRHIFVKYANMIVDYGGDSYLHGKSQSEVWKRTIAFFTKFLGNPIPPPEWRTKNKL